MDSDSEDQTVPTAKETTNTTNRRYPVRLYRLYFIFIIVIVIMGTPWIVWGTFKYDRANRFITQPGLCRVNSIEVDRSGNTFYSIWNVDIVRQSENNDAKKNLTVLHSSLSIRDTNGYWLAQLALEDAELLYSIGKVYPCYYRENLLNLPDSNTRHDNTNIVILWEKPSRIAAIALISAGLLIIGVGIFLLTMCCKKLHRKK